MNIVIDANVLVSAALSHSGLCASIIAGAIENHEVFLSEYILEEMTRNLTRLKFAPESARRIADYYRTGAEIVLVEPATVPPDACADPNDLPVLGTAVAANAQFLISGDKHLLELKQFRGISIVTPRQFLQGSPA